MKLNIFRRLGKALINIGIQDIEDVNLAKQLVEKGLAKVIEGTKSENDNKHKQIQKTPNKKKG